MASLSQIGALSDISRVDPKNLRYIKDPQLLGLIENARQSFFSIRANQRRMLERMGDEVRPNENNIDLSRRRIDHVLSTLQHSGIYNYVGEASDWSFSLDDDATVIGDYGASRDPKEIANLFNIEGKVGPDLMNFLGRLQASYVDTINYWDFLPPLRSDNPESQTQYFPSFIQILERLKGSLHVARTFSRPEVHVIPTYSYEELVGIFRGIDAQSFLDGEADRTEYHLSLGRIYLEELEDQGESAKTPRSIKNPEVYIVDAAGLTHPRNSNYQDKIDSYLSQFPISEMARMDEMLFIHFALRHLLTNRKLPNQLRKQGYLEIFSAFYPILYYENLETGKREELSFDFENRRHIAFQAIPLTTLSSRRSLIYYPMVGGPIASS